MGSWVRQFSQRERECNELILDKAVELFEQYGEGFVESERMYKQLQLELQVKQYQFKDKEKQSRYFCMKSTEIDNRTFELYKNTNKLVDDIERFQFKLHEFFINTDFNISTQKDVQLFHFRYEHFLKHTGKSLYMFTKEAIDSSYNVRKTIIDKFLEDEKKRQSKENISNITIIKEEQRYRKIFDYKEMLRLAQQNGYEHKRTSGDHLILQHKKSKNIIVIPAHQLGYGLMLEIQKQIRINKIA